MSSVCGLPFPAFFLTRVSGGEKGKVRKKLSITLADVDGVDMPTCSTPDGEETEAQIRSEGRPPQARSGSHSRANSWSGGGRPPSAHPDLDLDLEADTRGADKALLRTAGSNNYGEGGSQTSSSSMVVISVRSPTEEHVDPRPGTALRSGPAPVAEPQAQLGPRGAQGGFKHRFVNDANS